MANTIARLMVRIGGDISALERSLSKASRKIQDTGRQMQAMGRTMTTRISAPLAAVGGIALKTSAEFESLQQSMNILNGSVEEGARNFERLKRFSAETPFQLQDLARAQNTLQGFGLSADEAFESMQMIGDIAAVASGDIQGIGIAFGQAAAEGQLMTRDIRQLINQGVPALKLLSETMGVAESRIFDMASQGEISFEILQKAFREATSEGGLFADGMEKQAKTLGGVFSTMRDNIDNALASVGDTMSGLAKNMMQQVISLSQAFEALNQSTKQMIVTAGLLVAAIGPAIWIVGKLTVVIGAILSPISLAVAAIAGLIVIGKNMYDNWEVIAAELRHLWMGIKKVAWQAIGGIMEAFTTMSGGILRTLSDMASVVSPALSGPLLMAQGQIEAANKGIQESVEASKKSFEGAGRQAEILRNDITSLGDSFWSIMDAIEGGIGSGLSWLSDTIFPEVQKEADKTRKSIDRMTISVARATKTAGLFGDVLAFAKANMEGNLFGGITAQFQKVETGFDSISEAAKGTSNFFQRFKDSWNAAAEDASLQTEAVTQAFQRMSDQTISSLGDLLAVTLNTARQIISAEIAKGVAAAVRGALTNIPFPANIAAAAGAGAAAAALFNTIVPKLAQGGLAFGPTLAMVGDNRNARSDPEVIAPLSKLQGMMGGGKVQVEGQIRGDVIHLSNIRGGSKFR